MKAFDRWARKEGLSDDDLVRAADEIVNGQFEGNLGGAVVKKRVARAGGGKRGGFRTIVAYRSGSSSRIFFLHGYPKNAKADVTPKEKTALQTNAQALLGLSHPADSRLGERRRHRRGQENEMSEILESMRELAKSLRKVGAMDDITMKAMNDLCLPEVRKLGKAEVKAIRKKTRMSQPVFAAFIGVSPSAVAQWERGAKSPSGPAARLLDVIDRKGPAAIA